MKRMEMTKMNRAERRRQGRNQQRKQATYTVTRAQLDRMIEEEFEEKIKSVKQEVYEAAVNEAMVLLLTLPLEVLMDHYWKKTYPKKIPEFVNYVLEYYEKWQNDELDMDALREDLWTYGGIRLEADQVEVE